MMKIEDLKKRANTLMKKLRNSQNFLMKNEKNVQSETRKSKSLKMIMKDLWNIVLTFIFM